ncbi:DUF1559 family PulG-like putative transporter [Stieleria varia]|uniref:DUF1559 domain-containing protein n=1 Tax=Stieleria varia TaxID=2528005 RepID=A0A5C6A324_9BACT|nr:DUF1559 domain-containing protein [Stieleria varia]TWT92803.1 hypothetical protein Pla52n_61680 [Stieleria varia]
MVNTRSQTDGKPSIATRFIGSLAVLSLLLSGCGQSQADRMMAAAKARQARNQAMKDQDEKPDTPPPAPVVNEQPGAMPASDVATKTDESTASGDAGEPAKPALLPISERVPAEPLNDTERRKRAVSNIEKIADALQKHSVKYAGFPVRYRVAGNGIATLSWRVELLPYLGYEELYKKFDPEKPWNKEPNLSLLQYIPDEYVSPERFDTKTNYLVPCGSDAIFEQGTQVRRFNRIEDGVENTILLLEVPDSMAVEWTKPDDFSYSFDTDFKTVLGGLRKDGTYAAWANGWPVLISSGLSNIEVFNALTCDKGDGQLAGKIHREITISEVSEAAVATSTKPEEMLDDNSRLPSGPPEQAPVAPEPVVVRETVPSAADLAIAQEKLRKVFAEQIREARYDDDKRELAKTLLAQAMAMEDDVAGAYALQTAALRLAVDSGGAAELIQGIDQRVGRFEVDAYDETVEWLLAFNDALSGRDPDSVDGNPIITRAAHVIHAGVVDNDFLQAAAVARLAYRLTGQQRDEDIPRLLNKVKSQILAAQKEFDKAAEALSIYRNDPANVEAGAAFGRFLCFIKGDWGTGLPLIAEGGNEEVMEIAKLDLQGSKSYVDSVAIGDGWWNLSRRARGAYRQAAQDRAVAWYSNAYEVMPESLDRLHVKNRLDEAEEGDATSPMALCEQLAEAVNADLSISLIAISQPNGLRGGRANRGGNDTQVDEYD